MSVYEPSKQHNDTVGTQSFHCNNKITKQADPTLWQYSLHGINGKRLIH